MNEITDSWPLPCHGFLSVIEFITTISIGAGLNIKWGILSYGHHAFIMKTFDQWGVSYPHVMVTNDDTRWLNCPISDRVKPSMLLYHLTIQQLSAASWVIKRDKIVYFGDDLSIDGGQAAICDIPFGHFGQGPVDHLPKGSFMFQDWADIANFLQIHADDFRQGRPCAEIFAKF